MTVVNVFGRFVKLFFNLVRNHQRRSAGCVDFLIMMLFDNFNIKIILQNSCRLTCKRGDEIYAERHIRRVKNGNFFRRVKYLFGLRSVKSRCGNHCRNVVFCAVTKHFFKVCRVRKIYHNICRNGYFVKIVKNGIIEIFLGVYVKSGNDFHRFAVFDCV